MHYVHKKSRCGPEIATFRTKTLHFLRVIRLYWLAKIELRGTRRLWSSTLLFSYTVVSEKCQKETETEETVGFFGTFVSLVKFQLGVGLQPLPLPTPMLQVRKTKKMFANFPRGFWRFQRNFNCSENSAVLEPRTGQFSRT